VDIVALVKIPSSPIINPNGVKLLKARLSGAPLDGFDLDGGGQTWKNGVIEVRSAAEVRSYDVPYAGKDHAADLQATMLVQSDDRNIRGQAAEIVGKEKDSLEAAKKLNTWVYEAVNKQPVVSIPSAVEVLKQRVGDCNEHTTLYTALARAAGIPARMAAGIVYMKNGFYYHACPRCGWASGRPSTPRSTSSCRRHAHPVRHRRPGEAVGDPEARGKAESGRIGI